MGLNAFLGNAPTLETVERELEQDRLPHSMLFVGIQGIGKRTPAHFISMTVNCLRGGLDFCGQCRSCRKIIENCHPDVKHYEPEGQFIKIDQMRELSREVFFEPFEGKRRFFILDEADKMNLESANSILKTLEEPPENSHLILISNKPNELLTTIRSRCQTYRFGPLPSSEIEQVLTSKLNYFGEDLSLLSRISQGSIGRALSLDLKEYKKGRQELLDLLEVCSQNFLYTRALKSLTALAREKEAFGKKAEILYSLLRDLFLLKVDAACELITHWDIRGKLLSLCANFSFRQIVDGTNALDHIETGIKRNLSKPLALDHFVLSFSSQLAKED